MRSLEYQESVIPKDDNGILYLLKPDSTFETPE
jgi:hypothetical protein